MPTYVRDGLRLHYDVWGEGPPVLLAHGMTGSGRTDWEHLVGVLSASYRCVVPDFRGHARSEYRPGAVGYDALREDVRALLELEGMERSHLVGFSMGAEVLLDLELTYPGTGRSLTMMAPGLGVPDGHPVRPVEDGPPEDVPGWPNSLKRLQDEHHGPGHWRVLFWDLVCDWARRAHPTDDDLARISCPVLLVVGEKEFDFKRAQARQIHDAVPGCRLVELPGGHAIQLHQPDAVARLVTDFLADPA